jgi:hypothetical protein
VGHEVSEITTSSQSSASDSIANMGKRTGGRIYAGTNA